MSPGRPLGWIGVLPLYLALATAIGFVDHHVRPLPEHGYTTYVPAVLSGQAEPPGRYRVLAPYVYDRFVRLTGLSPGDGWIVFRWASLLAALLAGHLYFRTWFPTGPAVAGNLLGMALLPLTFTNSWAHPDHLLELGLFTLGCACLARGWHAGFLVVLALGALNRETSAFLLPLALFARPWTTRHLSWTALAVALWMAISLGLRWQFGWVPYNPWQLERNLEFLRAFPLERDLYFRLYPWFFLVLVLPLAALVAVTWARQPRFARVAAGIAAPIVIVACLLYSSLIETRIFTPMIPLLVPATLFAWFPPPE